MLLRWPGGVPGGVSPHLHDGRLLLGTLPLPAANPRGRQVASAAHSLLERMYGCGD